MISQILFFVFAIIVNASAFFFSGVQRACRQQSSSRLVPMSMKKATLDGDTLWRLSIKLQADGEKTSEATARVRFVDYRNYEPPQGQIFVEDDYNGLVQVNEKGYCKVLWTLSEDKENRKDGLWVWGLFEEPKYPFLYFSLDIFNSTILPSGEEEPIFGGKGIPKNRLNFRFSHTRDKEKGVILSDGEVTYQMTELMRADPLGIGGKVDVGDIIDAGVVEITPVLSES